MVNKVASPLPEDNEPATFLKTVTIVNARGLHARASAKFVNTANKFDAKITVTRNETTVPGDSIMGLMMLAASFGSTIEIVCSGTQGEEALLALAQLVEEKFGEE